ncbi:MAG: hypothetical protein DI584_04915 [Stenotrophomonas sp.]|nr:MAG: hypothetical protein DI584_04915 [Stenotrophomonas sp.]
MQCMNAKRRRWRSARIVAALGVLLYALSAASHAQVAAGPEAGRRVEQVIITLDAPGEPADRRERAIDRLRRAVSLFPGNRFSPEALDYALARAVQSQGFERADYSVRDGDDGGLVVHIEAVIGSARAGSSTEGMLVEKSGTGFPVLYDRDGTYVKLKAEAFALHYSNVNAWYGRPGAMLDGNPLAGERPAGEGYQQWLEGYLHGGVYGIAPLRAQTYMYGGASAMLTGSVGSELFTDQTRTHVAVEDAYLGLVTGRTRENGDRWVLNASAGRQRFTLGDGFLIVNTAANGGDRAALQANARWANDFLGLVQFQYNNTRIEGFRVDPDELPQLDTRTVIDGVNIELDASPRTHFAVSYLTVPESDAVSYLPDGGTLNREGLRVADVRWRWRSRPAGKPGWLLSGEYGQQRHRRADVRASAYALELGHTLPTTSWSPVLSYRYARFSGDDPQTVRFERWDPLLSGGNGEQWVQGINHFKVVQDSNVISHRVQARLRPTPRIELVPQLWVFRADSMLNLGGNPALSFLRSHDYGTEANLTVKFFHSRNLYLHGHLAVTRPGRAVKLALKDSPQNWWSSAFFVRYAF